MAGRSLMRRIAILAIVCLLLRVPCLAKGEQLTLFTEEYPPINYSEAGRASGLGSAIVSEIMQRAGIQASIEVVPWARGYRTVLSTPNTGLFVTARTPQREAAFRWVGPLVRTQGMLYGRRGDFPLIGVLEDAAKVDKLAVPRDWTRNRAIRMPAEIGTMKESSRPARPGASCRPSTADRTEMAGVMMPSP